MIFDRSKLGLVIGLLGTLLLSACSRENDPRPEAASPATNKLEPSPLAGATNNPASTNQQIYLVKGVIKEVMADKKKVKIAHEEIPDYMEAMTMVFVVKDGRDLAKVKVGDTVRFRMIVTADDGWIDNLVKIDGGAQTPVTSPAPENFRRALEVEPLEVGAAVANYKFTNQLGQTVSLHDFKGKAVGLTFIFTRCAFPTFCPRMSGNLAVAQEKLKAMPDGPTNWHLLSVTFDPEHDTPKALRSYGEQFKYDPAHWSLLTAELVDVTALAEQFGLMFWRSDPARPANIDHNLRTVVIDANGRVQKVFTENEWKVDDLVNEMVKAAKVQPGQPTVSTEKKDSGQ